MMQECREKCENANGLFECTWCRYVFEGCVQQCSFLHMLRRDCNVVSMLPFIQRRRTRVSGSTRNALFIVKQAQVSNGPSLSINVHASTASKLLDHEHSCQTSIWKLLRLLRCFFIPFRRVDMHTCILHGYFTSNVWCGTILASFCQSSKVHAMRIYLRLFPPYVEVDDMGEDNEQYRIR